MSKYESTSSRPDCFSLKGSERTDSSYRLTADNLTKASPIQSTTDGLCKASAPDQELHFCESSEVDREENRNRFTLQHCVAKTR